MDSRHALACFGALSQETRLSIVRLLVVAGPDGISAGALAEQIGVSPSNLSFHLKELEQAGLVSQRRHSRSILYAARYPALAELAAFLLHECCAGHPQAEDLVAPRDGDTAGHALGGEDVLG